MAKLLGDIAIQNGLYTLLSAGMSCAVYDFVPEETAFPYAVLSEFFCTPEDTKTSYGQEVRCQIDVFSAYNGYKEVKGLVQEIQTALDSGNLSVSGFKVWDYQLSVDYMPDADDKRVRRAIVEIIINMSQEGGA